MDDHRAIRMCICSCEPKPSSLIERGFGIWGECRGRAARLKNQNNMCKKCVLCCAWYRPNTPPAFLSDRVRGTRVWQEPKGAVCLSINIIFSYLKSVITPYVFLTCDHLAPTKKR